jgi:uncharacterized protein (DUF924 family)
MVTPDEVLRYWFGDGDRNDIAVNETKGKLWFGHAAETDAEITERFGAALQAAGRGELDAWADQPQGRVALIIVLDQFSRNIHRGSGAMYDHDARALRLATESVASGEHRDLAYYERVFTYMPLMHAEELDSQNRCVALFEQLIEDAPNEALANAGRNNLQYAVAHRDIVARFGRFPHRNELLGRPSTAEEREFLTQPGSSF